MDNEMFTNPLSMDERIIAEKLNISGYESSPAVDFNQHLKIELLQSELSKLKQQRDKLSEMIKSDKSNRREEFTGGCSCSEGFRPTGRKTQKHERREGCEDLEDSSDEFKFLHNRKFLFLVIFILAAFIISQYFTNKNELRHMIEDMVMLMKVQNMQPTPATTTATA